MRTRALPHHCSMLPLSDRLAVTRTALANERTLLAYGRTGLALMAAGVGVAEIFTARALALQLTWSLRTAGRARMVCDAHAADPGPWVATRILAKDGLWQTVQRFVELSFASFASHASASARVFFATSRRRVT